MTSRKFQASTLENNDDDSNVLFYVNKTGFPIDQPIWERMWNYAGKLYPEGKDKIDELRNRSDHKDVSNDSYDQDQLWAVNNFYL